MRVAVRVGLGGDEGARGAQVLDDPRVSGLEELPTDQREVVSVGPAATTRADAVLAALTVAGTSIMARISVKSSRSWSVRPMTRNPLLRTISTSPSLVRSSIASRTGVAEMPNSAASNGAE